MSLDSSYYLNSILQNDDKIKGVLTKEESTLGENLGAVKRWYPFYLSKGNVSFCIHENNKTDFKGDQSSVLDHKDRNFLAIDLFVLDNIDGKAEKQNKTFLINLEKLPDSLTETQKDQIKQLKAITPSQAGEEILKILDEVNVEATQKDLKADTPQQIISLLDHSGGKERFNSLTSADLSARDGNGETALHLAVKQGDAKIVELLLSKMSFDGIETENRDEATALALAIEKGNIKIVKLLLSRVSSEDFEVATQYGKVNVKDFFIISAMCLAVDFEKEEIVELLLSKMSFESDEANSLFNQTALVLALEEGNVKIVELIFDRLSSEDAKVQSFFADGALYVAVGREKEEILKMLLSRLPSEDIEGQGHEGTLLHLAVGIESEKIMELLLSKVSNESLNTRNFDGETALHLAVKQGNAKILELLLSKMSNEALDARSLDGETALLLAVRIGNVKIVELLLSKMSDKALDAQDKERNNALHLAAMLPSGEVLTELLSRGSVSKLSKRDASGCNVLEVAAKKGQTEVVICILELENITSHSFIKQGVWLHDLVSVGCKNKESAEIWIQGSGGKLLELIESDPEFEAFVSKKDKNGDRAIDILSKNTGISLEDLQNDYPQLNVLFYNSQKIKKSARK